MNSSDCQSLVADTFLHLASEILRKSDAAEGELRSAISRAYYAVYLTARDHLLGTDGANYNLARKRLWRKFKKKSRQLGSHDLVILAIGEVPKTTVINPKVLSSQLSQLKEARTYADYIYDPNALRSISATDWQEYCKENLELAALILPIMRRLPKF